MVSIGSHPAWQERLAYVHLNINAMKIKKTYMPYKVGLFVGLLSLNALYSCVDTNRQLGIRNDLQSQTLLEVFPSLGESNLEKRNFGAELAEKVEQYYGNSEVPYCNSKKNIYGLHYVEQPSQ